MWGSKSSLSLPTSYSCLSKVQVCGKLDEFPKGAPLVPGIDEIGAFDNRLPSAWRHGSGVAGCDGLEGEREE